MAGLGPSGGMGTEGMSGQDAHLGWSSHSPITPDRAFARSKGMKESAMIGQAISVYARIDWI
jgi:hypothetical protein